MCVNDSRCDCGSPWPSTVWAALADAVAIQLCRLCRTTPVTAQLRIIRAVSADGVMLDISQPLTILLPPHIPSVEDKAAVRDNGQIHARPHRFFDVHPIFDVQARRHAVILPLHASRFLTTAHRTNGGTGTCQGSYCPNDFSAFKQLLSRWGSRSFADADLRT